MRESCKGNKPRPVDQPIGALDLKPLSFPDRSSLSSTKYSISPLSFFRLESESEQAGNHADDYLEEVVPFYSSG